MDPAPPPPEPKPAAVFTIALGDEMLKMARFCRATFKASHPGVPFHIVDQSLFDWFTLGSFLVKRGDVMSVRAIVGWVLARFYRRVVYLDADTLVFGDVPALLDPADPLTVTHDIDTYLGEPRINAGVVAATGREPWLLWMREIFSQLVPVTINFIDQLALRELVGRNALPFRLLPEKETGDYYNFSAFAHPGAWFAEGGVARKGDARVRVFHFAGDQFGKDWRRLPKSLATLAATRAAAGRAFADYQAENAPLRAALDRCRDDYLYEAWDFFTRVPTVIRGVYFNFQRHPGIYLSDAPFAWDRFRNLEGTGIHRRTFPDPHRIVYARDPARLQEPDAGRVWAESWGG